PEHLMQCASASLVDDGPPRRPVRELGAGVEARPLSLKAGMRLALLAIRDEFCFIAQSVGVLLVSFNGRMVADGQRARGDHHVD
ncbi:MAG TPA: hypothetical protein VN845_08440, partial [Solirubrobacteraceae bacterium]|nr:hypothetical protein [Solirubrobacteraceae bacterium]